MPAWVRIGLIFIIMAALIGFPAAPANVYSYPQFNYWKTYLLQSERTGRVQFPEGINSTSHEMAPSQWDLISLQLSHYPKRPRR